MTENESTWITESIAVTMTKMFGSSVKAESEPATAENVAYANNPNAETIRRMSSNSSSRSLKNFRWRTLLFNK